MTPTVEQQETHRAIDSLTDQELFNAACILGAVSHLSRDSAIAQAKELLLTNKFYNGQTNIPGYKWFKLADYINGLGIRIS